MWWFVWSALAVSVVVPAVAAARTGVAAFRLWRDVQGARGAVFAGLDAAAAKAEEAAARAERIGGGSEQLARSLERLARSRRRLAVLQAAWDEVTDTLGVVTAYYPRK